MIERVYRGAVECRDLERVIVATDSPEIIDFCRGKGIPVHMTRADHASGTDRVWQVVEELGAEAAVNIQGDEPMVRGAMLSALIAALFSSPEVEVASLYTAAEAEEVPLPSVCKVVMDARRRALYFSRATIPFPREGSPRYAKHLGYYAYSRQALASFHSWPPSELESVERLEQLRFLDHGVGIQMAETPFNTIGSDTAEDLAQGELRVAANR